MFTPIEIKDVIEKDYQNQLYSYVTDIKFPWHFMEDTTNEKPGPGNSTPAFGHLLFHQGHDPSPHLNFFTPLVNAILEKSNMELISIIRLRLGFLLNTKYPFPSTPYQHNTPHVDSPFPHYTAVYYLNDCDGPTLIFRETEESQKYFPLHKSNPEKGKVLLFDGSHYHASTCPKIHNKRIVLTFNFTANLKS